MISFKRYLLAITGIFLLFSCTDSKKVKKAEVANQFVNYFLSELAKNGTSIAFDSYSDSDSEQCLSRIEDSLARNGFNMKDLTEVSLLKADLHDSIALISKEKFPKSGIPDSWRNFRKLYKNGFYIISVPIVNDKCDRVIFYYSYYCDDRCGNGVMALYEKNSSGWKLLKKYCDWIR